MDRVARKAAAFRRLRRRLGSLPGFTSGARSLRWAGYLVVCVTVLSLFSWGYFTKPLQEVAFGGEWNTGRHAKIYFESDSLGKVGTFGATVKKLELLSSEGGSTEVTLTDVEDGTCEELVEEFGEKFGRCERDASSNTDLISVSSRKLMSFSFEKPVRIEADLKAARAVSITEQEADGAFSASRMVEFRPFRQGKLNKGNTPECLRAGSPTESDAPVLRLTIRSERSALYTIGAQGLSKSVTPVQSSTSDLTNLLFRIHWQGEAGCLKFKTLHQQPSNFFSFTSKADFIRVERVPGNINLAGLAETVLDTEVLEVWATTPDRISVTDSSVSFRLGNASQVTVNAGDGTQGKSISRRRLETWPIWAQAIVGVLVSALVI